ncbi:UNVERIFIED_CONTAM: hypothetical protein RKD50_000022 [Streptomyces canus]
MRLASRQGGVHLLDGPQLQRWAGGASLDDLGLPQRSRQQSDAAVTLPDLGKFLKLDLG